jgi:hypothetical protein
MNQTGRLVCLFLSSAVTLAAVIYDRAGIAAFCALLAGFWFSAWVRRAAIACGAAKPGEFDQ